MMFGDDTLWKGFTKMITRKVTKQEEKELKRVGLDMSEYTPVMAHLPARLRELGAKHDQGKLLFGCLTQGLAPVLKGVAAVLTFGAQKYSRDSWQSVSNAKQRYHDAMERHLNAYNSGAHFDEESGLHHMLHMICCAMFVMWFEMDLKKYPCRDYTVFKKPNGEN